MSDQNTNGDLLTSNGFQANGHGHRNGHDTTRGSFKAPRSRRRDPLEIDFREVLGTAFNVANRGKWIILVVFLLTFGITAYRTYKAIPIYEAYSLLSIEHKQNTLAPSLDGVFAQPIYNQDEIIIETSLDLAQRVGERLVALGENPETGKPLSMVQGNGAALMSENFVSGLQGSISASYDNDSWTVMRVKARSTVPGEAALLANYFAEEYVNYTKSTGQERASKSREFLEDQIALRESELLGVESQIKDYMSSQGAVALDATSRAAVEQIASLEARINETDVNKQMRQAELSSLEAELREIQPRLAQRIASDVDTEIEEAQQEIARRELILEEALRNNPNLRNQPQGRVEVQQLEQEIAQLKARLTDLSQQLVGEVLGSGGSSETTGGEGLDYAAELKRRIVQERIAISGADAERDALEKAMVGANDKLSEIPRQSTQLAQLERNKTATENLYMLLLSNLEEARLAEESQIGSARVIRKALVPRAPAYPNKRRNMMLGILLGLCLGVAGAYLRFKTDAIVYAPKDIEKRGLKIIAEIPDMKTFIRNQFGKHEMVAHKGHQWNPSLIPYLRPLSLIADTYRKLFVNVHRGYNSQEEAQLILITSAEPEVGKSTTSVNLAITIAQSGLKTLLIDGDLYRPTIHKLLNMTSPVGLPELVQHVDKLKRGLRIEKFLTKINNLYVITDHARDENILAAELLGSPDMKKLIAILRKQFDVILFDSPPVLLKPDANLVGPMCNATVLVASAGSSDARAVEKIYDELRQNGVRVNGVLLNRFEPRRTMGYGYNKLYGYSKYSKHKYYAKS